MIGSQKGSVLIIVIAGITIIAAIGAGIATMRSSSGLQQVAMLDPGLSIQAYYTAESGLEWVGWKLNNVSAEKIESYCNDDLIKEKIPDGLNVKIISSKIGTKNGKTYCNVEASGWAGIDFGKRKSNRQFPVVKEDTPELGPKHPAYYALDSGDGTITVPFKASVDGNVYGKDVVLSSQSEVTGDVVAEKNVTLEFKSSVGSDICASEDVTLTSKAQVGGDIHAHGDVTVGWQSAVTGDVFADGNVTLDSDAEVMGSIHSGKSVTVGWNSVVKGDIFADGTVTLEGHAQVMGTVYAKKTVTLGWKDKVGGDVITEGDIDLNAGDNEISGDAIASGKIMLGWKSEIKGTQSEGDSDPAVKPPSPPKECPGVKTPELSKFSAGTTDISIGWKQDEKIVSGAYQDVSAGGKNSIYFTRESPGECQFVFNTLSLAWDLDLYLDLSQCVNDDGTPGDMTFFSEKDIQFGGKMNIFILTEEGKPEKMKDVDPEIAKRIYWETHGDFFQGSSSDWFGTVLAKNNIWFDSDNMTLIGAVSSVEGTVTMGQSVDVTYMPADYAVENW
ncbi:MAG: polymer-forming cytoskeletal protein [Desulfotignum sp.]|nr:polymer-forming cytoskeletal protein [Desulfotignum sp.]MCF8088917.1 polymer-forming cytoskeletal protein [Desulfotignum sp.]MCF8138216.1 polymer-forming cytoskeletal protein [Desulfotignum sp.]